MALRREALRSILDIALAARAAVLELRYGLDGQQPRTLDEVGRAFNVTRERIRQIEHQSLKKLRALAEAQQRARRRLTPSRGRSQAHADWWHLRRGRSIASWRSSTPRRAGDDPRRACASRAARRPHLSGAVALELHGD